MQENKYRQVTCPEVIFRGRSVANSTTLAFSNKSSYLVVADDEGGAQILSLAKPVPLLSHLCRNKIRAAALDRSV